MKFMNDEMTRDPEVPDVNQQNEVNRYNLKESILNTDETVDLTLNWIKVTLVNVTRVFRFFSDLSNSFNGFSLVFLLSKTQSNLFVEAPKYF